MNDLAVYMHLGGVVGKKDLTTPDQLVAAVMDAWDAMSPELLDRVAAVKCVVMRELITSKGKVIKIPSSKIREAQALGCLWELVELLC